MTAEGGYAEARRRPALNLRESAEPHRLSTWEQKSRGPSAPAEAWPPSATSATTLFDIEPIAKAIFNDKVLLTSYNPLNIYEANQEHHP